MYLPALWITTYIELVVVAFLGGFVSGSFWVTLGPVSADAYDEITISTGRHQEATYVGAIVFFNRIAYIGQALIFIAIHVATGYNPDPNAIQTDLAILGIRIHAGLIPSLLALLSFVIMYKYYDLIGEKQQNVKKKLREMGL